MYKSLKSAVLILVSLSFFCLTVKAGYRAKKFPPPRDLAIEMGTPFHDHAILQREMKVPVWGLSKPGTKVTVEFFGQKKEATADKDGKWMLELDPMKANATSQEMTITDSNGKKEVLKDILVGEVWMASGQSNMQWLAGACIVGRKLQADIKARVKEGKEIQPIIREGKVTNVFSAIRPRSKGTKAAWRLEWPEFSAISFAFAYDIWKEVKVPVGIVNCAFSTTKLEAWAPREGFAAGKDEFTKAIYKKIIEGDATSPEHKVSFDAYYEELGNWGKESSERISKKLPLKGLPGVPGNLNGNRDATWMCNGKIVPMAPYAIRGAIWNQGYANSNDGIVYRNNLHSLVRGWRALWKNPKLPIYFHQFYSFKNGSPELSLQAVAEMRMGTWLAHKDIPNAAMASQIDVTGGVHYYNKAVSGQRLALHALKNQYGKDIVANGPMYKDYKVKGDKLILELDHAYGLFVGQDIHPNGGYVTPTPVENGEEQIEIFYIADKDKLWHKAKIQIEGEKIILSAPGVKEPHGVAYGCGGVGRLVSIYNKAKLPLTPFIVYDKKIVISNQWDPEHIRIPGKPVEFYTWPEEFLRVAGVERDPASYGLRYKYRKLWLLSPQFTHHCVIQEGVPTRFYRKAVPNSVIKFNFAGTTKTLKMGPEQTEWEVTVPPMAASAKPKTLNVTCLIDGQVAHERKIQNVVVGDVWYVAAPMLKHPGGPVPSKGGPCVLEDWKENQQLRMMFSYGKRDEAMPQRFKVNASGWPASKHFAKWSPTVGIADELAKKIHAKTGKPVGIVLLDTKGASVPIKSWTGFNALKEIPAWKADYDELKPFYQPNPQGPPKNAEQYVKNWKEYWQNVQTDETFESGAIPSFPGVKKIESKATRHFNQSICAFTPGNFKAILFLTGKDSMGETEGADFGKQFAVMANSWKDAFARGKEVIDPHFVYALPSSELAAKVTKPEGIKGKNTPVDLKEWVSIKYDTKKKTSTYNPGMLDFLDQVVKSAYK